MYILELAIWWFNFMKIQNNADTIDDTLIQRCTRPECVSADRRRLTRVYRGWESSKWINSFAMLWGAWRGEEGGDSGSIERVPLKRRHNVLRVRPGLIRKCLTLVKHGLDRPDVLHDTPGNPHQGHPCGGRALCLHSRIYYDPCRFTSPTVVSSARSLAVTSV